MTRPVTINGMRLDEKNFMQGLLTRVGADKERFARSKTMSAAARQVSGNASSAAGALVRGDRFDAGGGYALMMQNLRDVVGGLVDDNPGQRAKMLSAIDVLKKEFGNLTESLDEKAPKGWEGTVKAMKKKPEIDNPYALAHWQKGQGHKSRKAESINEARPVSKADVQVAASRVTKTLGEAYNAVIGFKGALDTMENIPTFLLQQYRRTGPIMDLVAKAKALAYQSEMELRRI